MKYTWTDWIKHIPGQELPAGLFVECEFVGKYRNGGHPYIQSGIIEPHMRGHGSWKATHPGDRSACVMLLRYRIRVEEYDQEADASKELETA